APMNGREGSCRDNRPFPLRTTTRKKAGGGRAKIHAKLRSIAAVIGTPDALQRTAEDVRQDPPRSFSFLAPTLFLFRPVQLLLSQRALVRSQRKRRQYDQDANLQILPSRLLH